MEKPKLLIVDDDKRFLSSLVFALEKDFQIDTASDLENALTKLDSKQYNIVSTDGAFPEYEGGPLGNHGNLSEKDYRGDIVARCAKEKGIYVLGVTAEPDRLKEPDMVLKKPINVLEYKSLLKKYS